MERKTLPELRKIAKELGIKTGGKTKEDIVWDILAESELSYVQETADMYGVEKGRFVDMIDELAPILAAKAPASKKKISEGRALSIPKMLKTVSRYNPVGYTDSGIPKIIHQIWIGADIPLFQALYMNRWKTMDGWRYMLWTNDYINEENFPKTFKYIEKARRIGKEEGKNKFAQIADLMRLEIIDRYGGVYADSTLEPLKHIGSLFEGHPGYKFVVSNEDPCDWNCVGNKRKKYVSNSFFAGVPHHPFLERILSEKVLEKIDFSSKLVNMETGPYFIRRHMRKSDGITFLPTDLIYPHGYETAYSPDRPDKCFDYEPFEGSNLEVTAGDSSKRYIQYPCSEYPDSYTIKHWEIGGSWR